VAVVPRPLPGRAPPDGRIYVFAGVLPSGLLAIPTSVYGSSGLSGSLGNVLLAVTWLATTFAGFRMARQKRFAEHRRWMIRSFALCTSIVLNRVWVVVLMFGVAPALASNDAELEVLTGQAIVAAIWLSWVVNLLLAEWWIERTRKPKRQVTPTKEPALVA
jgi:hypothetical protein